MERAEFQFLGYRISSLEMLISDDYRDGAQIAQSLNITVARPEKQKSAEVTLSVNLDESETKFKLNLEIKGGFRAHSEMSEDLFLRMCNVNAPSILYPFARAIISSTTAQCGIRPIMLPVVNFTRRSEAGEEHSAIGPGGEKQMIADKT